MPFSKEVRDALWGEPFAGAGQEASPPLYDGRTAALRIFKKYIRELTFYRPGDVNPVTSERGPSVAFRIPERDIHIEWPDNDDDLHQPSIAFLAESQGEYQALGLNNNVDEESRDKYGKDTHLIWQSEYVETFVLEIWAKTKQERRAIIRGIEVAMSPLQQMAGIRFLMPDYYDQLVCMDLQNRQLVDDDQASFARRKARLMIEMRHNVVSLVKTPSMDPQPTMEVDEDEPAEETTDLNEP